MKDTYREAIQRLDRLIREGESKTARPELSKLTFNRVPQELLVEFANLARRAGLPNLAIRILRRTIHPTRKGLTPPTPKERASYASSLAAVGAQREAREILNPCLGDQTPEVLLAWAFLEIYEWNYAGALPALEAYIRAEGPTPYQKIVAQLNFAIAASYLGRLHEFPDFIPNLLKVCLENGWKLIALEAHLLEAQTQIREAHWAGAATSLQDALLLAENNGLDTFYIRKWKVLGDLHRLGHTFETARSVSRLREEAVREGMHETVRDCDYHLTSRTLDENLACRIIFGTPLASYKQRVRSLFSTALAVPQSYEWRLRSGRAVVNIDLESGHYENARHEIVQMDRGGSLVKILRALCRDFYRPLRVGGLFTLLYPGEFFDPNTSPGRVRTALSRARAELDNLSLPIAVACEGREYSLIATGPCTITVREVYSSDPILFDELQPHLKKLRDGFQHKAFTSAQAAEALKLERTKALEILKAGASTGVFVRLGQGRSTLFRLATEPRSKLKQSA